MALGALIGAYQEDDSGGLRALLPLSGRTLLEYQVRCAAAAGASPIVVLVERVPVALQDAFERLRGEGISVTPVSDGLEAASRFEAGAMVLLVSDGIAPPSELLAELAALDEPTVVTVPDDGEHDRFERVDGDSRWAGLAVIDARSLGSTAAMVGDWDLPSTLLRRTLQDGAARLPLAPGSSEPLLADEAGMLDDFDRRLLIASRGARRDWASRYVLPIAEEFATERLLETRVKPDALIWSALLLTLGGAFAFTRGWLAAGLVLLVLSTPLDLVARRLATLRLRPLPARLLSRMMIWPASGVALLALGWWIAQAAGWWALVAALAAAAFAEAARVERGRQEVPGQIWLFSRRNAIILAIPFAIAGAWPLYLAVIALYAAVSFFYLQHIRHRIAVD